jgi:hypothetical protein
MIKSPYLYDRIIITFYSKMELKILINGGNRCDVKFERHHTFERVIRLLKSNKILPEGLSDR